MVLLGAPITKLGFTGTKSYRSKLTKDLRQFCTAAKGSVTKDASCRSLALSLSADVKTQWSTLCSFIGLFYIELTGVVNFPKDKAWKLTSYCIAPIFISVGSY